MSVLTQHLIKDTTMNNLTLFIQNFFMLLFESAPWLLFGFLMSGLIKFALPPNFLHKHLGGKNVISVVKGALIGAPIPLCSCSVIPVALGIRRSGASKAATTSFLIASPETGVDSIAVTYALLGPFMAVIRPIAAVTTAIITGLTVMFFEKKEIDSKETESHPLKHSHHNKQCCSTKEEPKTHCCASQQVEQPKKSCCSSKQEPQDALSFSKKVYRWFQFSLIDLVNDTAMWLLIGLIISAAIITWIPSEFLETWGASSYAYLIMALMGVPMYICATSSTPLAVGLLFAGVSPGAILVFLLAGPATNVATLAIVKQELGKKILVIYLSCLILISFVFGWITDYLANFFHIGLKNQMIQEHSMGASPLSIVCGLILLILMAYVLYFRKYLKK
ncbi:SO_0444 family Cu/Zn efflux transporter [Pasteurella atlantica]|nr:SO_0444 family Cu/Zn efflux transporter [Pasteurella atlantica]